MSNRKSSIAAEIKLTGQASYRNDLNAVSAAARKTGADISRVKGTPAFMLAGGRVGAVKAEMEKTEAMHRAHRRVLERDAATSAARMKFYDSAGVSMGGRGGRAGRAGYGLGVGYNAVQDLVQGGPAAIANNIPQIVEMVASSPALKGLAGVAVAAAAGFAAYSAYQYASSVSEAGNDAMAGDRYARNKAESNRKEAARIAALAREQASARGEAIGARHGKYGGVVDQEIAGVTIGSELMSEVRTQQQELRRMRLEAIEDPAERAKALAEDEKRTLDENLRAKRELAQAVMRIATQEQATAESRKRAILEELAAQTNAAKTPEELNREVELKKELTGLEERLAGARERSSKATEGMNTVKGAEQVSVLQKKMIDERTEAEVKSINRQKEIDEIEGHREQQRQMRDFRRMKRDADEKIAEQQKSKQEIIDGVNRQEELSRMSPRQKKKAEEADLKASRIKDFMDKGLTKEEATKAANQLEGVEKQGNGRIKGAVSGRGGAFGVGTTQFSGLEELAAMQPQQNERGNTGGGRRQRRDNNADNKDGPQSLGGQLFQAINNLTQAVREIKPDANTRGKPISTSAR